MNMIKLNIDAPVAHYVAQNTSNQVQVSYLDDDNLPPGPDLVVAYTSTPAKGAIKPQVLEAICLLVLRSGDWSSINAVIAALDEHSFV